VTNWLDFSKEDLVDMYSRILWKGIMGKPYPKASAEAQTPARNTGPVLEGTGHPP
jgi:hypothetical protein